MNPVARAIEIVGGVSALARKVGCSRQAVYNWKSGALQVPAELALKIEEATLGRVKRQDLRPDLYEPA